MYLLGQGGLPKDEQRAFNLFRQAAVKGDRNAQEQLRTRGMSW